MPKRRTSKRVEQALAMAELAQATAEAAFAAGADTAQGFNAGAIATGSIPNPNAATGVVVAHVSVTPKFSGKFLVRVNIQTSINGNAAAQSVQGGIGHTGAAPTDGTTTLAADYTTGVPITPVAINGSADVTQELAYQAGGNTIAGPFPVGTPVFFCALLTQSVAGAFSVPAAGAVITAEEIA